MVNKSAITDHETRQNHTIDQENQTGEASWKGIHLDQEDDSKNQLS